MTNVTTKQIERQLKNLNYAVEVQQRPENQIEKRIRFYQIAIDKYLVWFQGNDIALTFNGKQYSLTPKKAEEAHEDEQNERDLGPAEPVNSLYWRESVGMPADECIAALAKVRAQRKQEEQYGRS